MSALTPIQATNVVTVTVHPALDWTVGVQNLSPGAVNRAEDLGARPGGKGINVAAALAAHGRQVAALGFLGRENAGPFDDFLKRHHISDGFIRVPGVTRTGIKIVDPVRGETTDFNFNGPSPSTAEQQDLLDALSRIDAPWCVLAGSLAPGLPLDFYPTAINRLRARGVRVALDTSGPALAAALGAAPDVIKPNEHELSALIGRPLPDEAAVLAAARTIASAGVGLVVVSRGSAGALFVTKDQAVRAVPPAITVRSTVGAGDAMVAGIVDSSLEQLTLADLARRATAFSLHALAPGTDSSARAGVARYAAEVLVDALP